MQRQLTTVAFEALIIGIMNAALFYLLQKLDIKINTQTLLILCGALIHIIFEYSGGNEWWCRQTYK